VPLAAVNVWVYATDRGGLSRTCVPWSDVGAGEGVWVKDVPWCGLLITCVAWSDVDTGAGRTDVDWSWVGTGASEWPGRLSGPLSVSLLSLQCWRGCARLAVVTEGGQAPVRSPEVR